ncbi:unnamed protein product, partial [marine sediment metagenome]
EREGIFKLTERIDKVFTDASTYRAERIARTETIWGYNHGREEAWIQSDVVEGKEWLTAADERVCPWCDKMNGKTIGLGKNYFDKGDKLKAGRQTLKFDFENIQTPPLHANCRCCLISILK